MIDLFFLQIGQTTLGHLIPYNELLVLLPNTHATHFDHEVRDIPLYPIVLKDLPIVIHIPFKFFLSNDDNNNNNYLQDHLRRKINVIRS